MRLTFHGLDQVFCFLISRSQSQVRGNRSYYEALSPLRIPARVQSFANQLVHGGLERIAGAADLVLHETGHIVVDSKRRSHIMMLFKDHHDVNFLAAQIRKDSLQPESFCAFARCSPESRVLAFSFGK